MRIINHIQLVAGVPRSSIKEHMTSSARLSDHKFDEISSIHVTPEEDVYILDKKRNGSGALYKFNIRGEKETIQVPLDRPDCITGDSHGNLYIADSGRVIKMTPTRSISTIAGIDTTSGANGTIIGTELKRPYSICVSDDGRLWIADIEDFVVKMMDANGQVSIVAGNRSEPLPRAPDSENVRAIDKPIVPTGVSYYNGELYVSDLHKGIRKVDQNGNWVRVAGDSLFDFSSETGMASNRRMVCRNGFFISGNGEIYIPETRPDYILKDGERKIVNMDYILRIGDDNVMNVLMRSHSLDHIDSGNMDYIMPRPVSMSVSETGALFIASSRFVCKIESIHKRPYPVLRPRNLSFTAPIDYIIKTLTPKFYRVLSSSKLLTDDEKDVMNDLVLHITQNTDPPYCPSSDIVLLLLTLEAIDEEFLNPLRLIMTDRFKTFIDGVAYGLSTALVRDRLDQIEKRIDRYSKRSGMGSWMIRYMRYYEGIPSVEYPPLPFSDSWMKRTQFAMTNKALEMVWEDSVIVDKRCAFFDDQTPKRKLFSKGNYSYWGLFREKGERDVIITIKGIEYNCHRVVLASESRDFRFILFGRSISDIYSNTIYRMELKDDDFSPFELECMIAYCYRVLDLEKLSAHERQRVRLCLSKYGVRRSSDEILKSLNLSTPYHVQKIDDSINIHPAVDELITSFVIRRPYLVSHESTQFKESTIGHLIVNISDRIKRHIEDSGDEDVLNGYQDDPISDWHNLEKSNGFMVDE